MVECSHSTLTTSIRICQHCEKLILNGFLQREFASNRSHADRARGTQRPLIERQSSLPPGGGLESDVH